MLGHVARSIYIASAEGDTGKSAIALGVTALLARSVGNVGIFRPVARVADGSDYVLQLLLGHDGVDLSYEESVGVTYEDLHADLEGALATIVSRFHEVQRKCDAVVIVGTDYTDVSGAAEFEFNARIAANLGSPVALVVHGRNRTPKEIAQVVEQARAEMETNHAKVAAVFANRCDPNQVEEVRAALPADIGVGALPEDALLVAPLLSALVSAVDGQLLSGDPELLTREVRKVLVGAMTVDHLLEHVRDAAVVITPGDRTDNLLALISAHGAAGFPSLSGIILNGGFKPTATVTRLLAASSPRYPSSRPTWGPSTQPIAAGTRAAGCRASPSSRSTLP
jgi:phosphate acetyltransferase